MTLRSRTCPPLRRVTLGVACLLAGLTISACGNSSVPVPTTAGSVTRSSAAAAGGLTSGQSSPSGVTGQSSSASVIGSLTGSTTREAPAPITVDQRTFLAPPRLTFPPDSRVNAVFPSDFATTVHLDPPEDAAIVAYFRERLPGWGYAMTNDNGTVLTAAGRGWAITVNGAMVIFGYSDEAAAALAPVDQETSMWLTRADLGLRHAPLFMRYPAGTTATGVTDPESGASYRLAGHSPEEFLAFYRAHLTDMRFSVTADATAAEATTLRFTEEDGYTSTITVTATEFRIVHRL